MNIIAPDANISDLNIFEPQGWPDLSLTILAWDQTGENYAAYRNADIINYSIEYQWSESQLRNNGIDPNWTLKEYSDWQIQLGNTPHSFLVVVAAGDQGADCDVIANCNLLAFGHEALGSASITVGTLNENGTELADYSNRAGMLMNSFIAAPTLGDSGTSFSAPVVTGTAALIMDKFDTNAEQTRQIIFKTADDLGAPGVDPIFGHGALNVGRALSPVGNLR